MGSSNCHRGRLHGRHSSLTTTATSRGKTPATAAGKVPGRGIRGGRIVILLDDGHGAACPVGDVILFAIDALRRLVLAGETDRLAGLAVVSRSVVCGGGADAADSGLVA